MPRPRTFSLAAPSAALAADYSNGHSPRVIARVHGVTRWAATQAVLRSGISLRSRDDTMGVTTHGERLPRCVWPDCETLMAAPGICPAHVIVEERTCGWPRCGEVPRVGGLCYWHGKRAAGAG